ncbi:MAG TPA: hypothetical protein ENH59_00365 [Bacteroidetes bacterium]|nr:hypothetical protein [Bacteroidota bacterium]
MRISNADIGMQSMPHRDAPATIPSLLKTLKKVPTALEQTSSGFNPRDFPFFVLYKHPMALLYPVSSSLSIFLRLPWL